MPLRLLLPALVLLTGRVRAAEPVDYLRDIKPIFNARCVHCHGALQQKAGLRLDAGQLVRKGGKYGPVAVPGKSSESSLIEAIVGKDRSRMPPEKDGPALSDKQIALLRDWIDHGAKAPNEPVPEDPSKHWAFRKPVRSSLPGVKATSEVRNPVDVFLLANLQANHLQPRPETDRATLLRRVTFDLTGLPPTPEEQRAFLADQSADAYEKVVDRLLRSPQHGERWARHWMDVWRYSDWYGRRSVPDVWNSAPQVYRWRNWIVNSLNADHGYDRMVSSMLAGDEITPEDDAARDATGYLVRNWYALNPNQWMRDIVEHTGKAFLGLTFNCCHCHDHKYDPISQEEYFRFRAFFEPIGLRQDRVPGEADPGPFQKYDYSVLRKVVKTGAIRIFDENAEAKTLLYNGGDERDVMKGKPPVTPGAPAFLAGSRLTIAPVKLPATVWYPGLRDDLRREDIQRLTSATTVVATTPLQKAEVETAKARLATLKARIAADDVKYGRIKGDIAALSRAASKAEREANVRAAEERLLRAESASKVVKTEVDAARKALDAAKKALTTDSNTYTPLSQLYPQTSTGRRKALAQWITSKDNPLTARVAVNHIWKHYFGRPIVETVADLGRNGAKPSHPELLDWLAVELMDSGWSMKHVHRLIVTSAAYRMQSTAAESPGLKLDPDNRLLWRFPSKRLEAEAVRDAILACTGELDTTMGGASLDNVADAASRRRSLYFSVYPEGGGHERFLELFDPPDPCDCYKRTASIVPQQALALTNSRLMLDHSRLLARKIGSAISEIDFIVNAFERMLARKPTSQEQQLCGTFLRRQEEAFRSAKAVPTTNGEATIAPSADPRMRARESLIRVLFNHDDFLTIR